MKKYSIKAPMQKIYETKKTGIHRNNQWSKRTRTRRDFLTVGSITVLCFATSTLGCAEKIMNGNYNFSFGIITDLHYAEKEMQINRYYRESDEKLRECIETFNSLQPDFIIELGDFVDSGDRDTELGYFQTINTIFKEFDGDRYYVIGNHDLSTFSKEEFIRFSGSSDTHFSFDHEDCHFVVLDANFKRDGSDYNAGNFDWMETFIPESQLKWLKNDFEQAKEKQTIVFVHQNLNDENSPYGVKNAPEVRKILESAGNVLAVFQGHDHSGGYAVINGIHYVTFRAAVEGSSLKNNAFAVVYMSGKGNIRVKGYKKQRSIDLF